MVVDAFTKGTSVMICGTPLHVRWAVDFLKQQADPVTVNTQSIVVYKPADNKPYTRIPFAMFLCSVVPITYRVCCDHCMGNKQ